MPRRTPYLEPRGARVGVVASRSTQRPPPRQGWRFAFGTIFHIWEGQTTNTSHKMATKATVIFDNGGGITMQLGSGYAHHYTSPRAAATDLRDYFATGSTEGWDGHENDASQCKPTADEIRNGAYVVAVYASWQEVVDDKGGKGWDNIQHFDAVVMDLDAGSTSAQL